MKAVLFDLDGTLLPMDQEVFTKTYFHDICKKMTAYGYEPESLSKGIWKGTAAMVCNNGEDTNENVFWKKFQEIFGEKGYADKVHFDEFYANEFEETRRVCGCNPEANRIIKVLKSKGIRVILASNPLFPEVAQKKRMQWAGVDSSDFEYITTYENSHYCKPNPQYYTEILQVIGCDAEDCLMVGNDAKEDLIAEEARLHTFLLTDCMLNTENKDITSYARGGFTELGVYLDRLIG